MKKFLVLILLIVCSLSLQSQETKQKIVSTRQYINNYSIAGGFHFNQLLGESVGRKAMISFEELSDTSRIAKPGGSYDGIQSGLELRMTYYLGDEDEYKIPFGVTYDFFRAKEYMPINAKQSVAISNSHDILSMYFGFDYKLLDFWRGNVNLYAGTYINMNYIYKHTFEREIIKKFDPDYDSTSTSSKDDAFRIGPNIHFGFEGEIDKNWHLNFTMGVGILNLIGRDDDRGEILTNRKVTATKTYTETHENLEFSLQFSLLLQYRM